MWCVGQRIVSQSEPELGLGLIKELDEENKLEAARTASGFTFVANPIASCPNLDLINRIDANELVKIYKQT